MTDDSTTLDMNQVLHQLVNRRVNELGELSSGAFHFYAARLAGGRMMMSYDCWLPPYITGLSPSSVTYAGCGFAFAGFALALRGIKVCAIERDERRYGGLNYLFEELSRTFPMISENFSPRYGLFPEAADPAAPGELLLFCNFVARLPPEMENAIMATFPSYGAVILSERLFGAVRNSEDDREALAAKLIAATGAPRLPLREHFALYQMSPLPRLRDAMPS